ncbi:MAG TPA: ATP-binding protein, partial [Chitinophagaceae bacterium]|nr:ATP-binding protein [Chitinophagaceae bacterium]
GDFTRSLEMDLKIIGLFEEMGDTAAVARNLGNAAQTYYELGNLSKATEFYTRALEINKRLARKLSMANNLVGLGTIQNEKGDLVKALDDYMQALQLHREVNSKLGLAGDYSSIGSLYLKLARSANDSLLGLFSNASRSNLLRNARLYTDSSIVAYEALRNVSGVQRNHARLSEILELSGDFAGALGAYKKYKELSDSISSMDKDRKVEAKLMQYEFDKKQAVEALERERQRARERLVRNIQFAAILLFLFIAAVLYWNNRQKQKAKAKIEMAYAELKDTQAQLIQSEKMASLGELTAGIAHEIQNPLNFVNNFSEVNTEMIAEGQDALKSGNWEGAEEILNTLADNNEKILQHGKRADAIVKGMLQHSQKGSGVKEPTNINAMANEYVRIAYHGLKAKDKSFHATLKTEFDETIGKVNIIPQDIGRVLLNLVNNAFYAVDEKKKQLGDGYEPEVTVRTKLINAQDNPSIRQSVNLLMISVRDNGNGIPPEIQKKIFQPFFTTKPTGQGTGLGLSLSYDIVKAHGGEIKVESKEREGTTFIIQLPVG